MDWKNISPYIIEIMIHKSIISICLLCSFFTIVGYADGEILVTEQNEFFGETFERVIQFTGPQKHIHKIRYHYNEARVLMMHEVFLTQFMAANKGFYKMRVYFDKKGNRVRKELYYLDFLDGESGYYKKVIKYNSSGKIYSSTVLDKYGSIIPE